MQSAFEELDLDAVKYLLEERGLAEPTLGTLNILWPITPAPSLNEFEARVTVHFLGNLICTLDEAVTIIRMAA